MLAEDLASASFVCLWVFGQSQFYWRFPYTSIAAQVAMPLRKAVPSSSCALSRTVLPVEWSMPDSLRVANPTSQPGQFSIELVLSRMELEPEP